MGRLTLLEVVPAVFAVGAALMLAQVLASQNGFYRQLTSSHQKTRFESLDGLRGFLALGVFLSHSFYTRTYLATGEWHSPSRLLDAAAKLAVVLFFMITGFLFWSKALTARGRLDLVDHFRGRFLRLCPLYLFGAVAVLLVVVALSGHGFRYEPRSLLKLFSFGAFEWNALNGFDPDRVNAGVTWTLRYEWRFYLLLPLLALLLSDSRRFMVAVLGLGAYRWWIGTNRAVDLMLVFACGMSVAQILHGHGKFSVLTSRTAATLCLFILLVLLFAGKTAYHPETYIPVTFVFLCVVSGNTLHGLLASPAAKQLGSISYSFYMLHGIVLFLAGRAVMGLIGVRAMTDPVFWAFMTLCGVTTVGISSLTYRFIEHPFIELERKLKTSRRSLATAGDQIEPKAENLQQASKTRRLGNGHLADPVELDGC